LLGAAGGKGIEVLGYGYGRVVTPAELPITKATIAVRKILVFMGLPRGEVESYADRAV
jgi:hypothetical protein